MNLIKYPILLFWKIGKSVYEERNIYENTVQKYSDYYSYYFGDSILFTREKIHLMKRFYLNFPIFYSRMENISWEQYQVLFQIHNKKKRYFYFYLSLLFHSSYEETCEMILNRYYERI